MRVFTILLWLMLVPGILLSQEFTSPRASAIAAYMSISDDIFGLDWNPSAVALANPQLQTSFSFPSGEELVIRNLGLLLPLGRRHVLLLRKTPEFVTSTSFRKLPELQNLEDLMPFDLLNFFQYEQNWTFGYALKINSGLAVGIDLKQHKFSNNLLSSSRSWNFSLSASCQINEHFRLAIVARNLLQDHYRKHNDKLVYRLQGEPDFRVVPVNYESFTPLLSRPAKRLDLAMGYQPFRALQLSLEGYTDGGISAGLEWQPWQGIYFRQGISRKSDGLFKEKKVALLSSGLGIKYGNARLDLAVLFGNDALDVVSQPTPSEEYIFRRSNFGKKLLTSVVFLVR